MKDEAGFRAYCGLRVKILWWASKKKKFLSHYYEANCFARSNPLLQIVIFQTWCRQHFGTGKIAGKQGSQKTPRNPHFPLQMSTRRVKSTWTIILTNFVNKQTVHDETLTRYSGRKRQLWRTTLPADGVAVIRMTAQTSMLSLLAPRRRCCLWIGERPNFKLSSGEIVFRLKPKSLTVPTNTKQYAHNEKRRYPKNNSCDPGLAHAQ